jgi:AcrR family transcriptional regulator
MPRSGADARRRLRDAALELLGERGFDAVTTAEIATRAGVTERTFFRHFKDKREALFDGEEDFRTQLAEGVRAAPAELSPLAALVWSFRRVEAVLLENRSFSVPRAALISRTPALQERVLTKTAGLTAALAKALVMRGVDSGAASLAAQVGMAVFSQATESWLRDQTSGLEPHLTRALEALQAL